LVQNDESGFVRSITLLVPFLQWLLKQKYVPLPVFTCVHHAILSPNFYYRTRFFFSVHAPQSPAPVRDFLLTKPNNEQIYNDSYPAWLSFFCLPLLSAPPGHLGPGPFCLTSICQLDRIFPHTEHQHLICLHVLL